MRILQTSLTGDDKQPSSTIQRADAQQAECWSRRNSCYENVFTFVPCAFNDFSFDLFMNSKSCFAYSVFFSFVPLGIEIRWHLYNFSDFAFWASIQMLLVLWRFLVQAPSVILNYHCWFDSRGSSHRRWRISQEITTNLRSCLCVESSLMPFRSK